MIKRLTEISCAAAASAVLLSAGSASALTALGTTAGGYVQLANYNGYNDITPLVGLGSASHGGTRLTIGGAPGGSVTAVSQTPSASLPYVTFADGSLIYYIDPVAATDFDFTARLYYNVAVATSGGGVSSYAAASVVIGNQFGQVIAHNGQSSSFGSGAYLDVTETTNTPFEVSISAESENGGYAYADPLAVVDPNWAAAHPGAGPISFVPTAGVINGLGVAAVPEPATWAMMMLGLFGAGAVLRRRRQETAKAVIA